jgi:DNA-binding MarR family transcriptional regulator
MDGDPEAILAWLNLSQAYAVLRAGLGRALEAEAGVGISEIEVLRRLVFAPDQRLRMRDLADQLSVAQSGVTRIVDRLVSQGWVVREQPPDDRRTIYARLTDAGRSVVERAGPVYARTVTEQLGHGMSPTDLAELRRVLRIVLEGLGAWDDERCDPQHAEGSGADPGHRPQRVDPASR